MRPERDTTWGSNSFRKTVQDAEKEFEASCRSTSPELVTVPDYSIGALLNLGNVYALQGDLVRAKEHYRAVLSYDPHHPLKAVKRLAAAIKDKQENRKDSEKDDAAFERAFDAP